MRSIIRWSVNNSAAINIIMLALLATGVYSMASMRRESWPYSDLDEINIRVVYRGASPEEVEEAICERIEAAVQSINGVDEVRSTAKEGAGTVELQLDSSVDKADVQRILGEVRAAVDQIPSFPALAEEPQISQRTPRTTAIRIGVIGPDDEGVEAALKLRRVAELVRSDLLRTSSISQVNILAEQTYQIDVEISEETLRRYKLSLTKVANLIRDENLEMPGGTWRTESQEILLRGSNKFNFGTDIAKLPLVKQPNGVVLTVGDLGVVRDEFSDDTSISRLNGRPAIALSVETTPAEDLLEVGRDVYHYVETKQLPEGFELVAYGDRTDDVRDRIALMAKNGWQGLLLVFILLALFLDLRLAFWVAMGIPVSLLGACIFMYYTGQTLNLTSLFAFLIALGIVVDDAIVIGENIYVHREQGKSYAQAAIDGTLEVMPSVTTSVVTTIVAFLPMLFVTGRLGRFTTVLPLAVIAMLLISLIEGLTILPSHLAHRHSMFMSSISWLLYPLRPVALLFGWLNDRFGSALDVFIRRVYLPFLSWSLAHPPIVISCACGLLLIAIGVVRSGAVPYVILPRTESNVLQVMISYPDGTPGHVTDAATRRLEKAIMQVNQESIDKQQTDRAEGVVIAMHRAVGHGASSTGDVSNGSHVGSITVSLIDSGMRQVGSTALLNRWRQLSGSYPGSDSLVFSTGARGPAAAPIEFSLLARDEDLGDLEAAIQRCTEQLGNYPGVYDITAGSRPGKYEYRLRVKEDAKALGVTQAELSRTVRASFFGESVMRLQRGRHEVELRVRYPREQRRSMGALENIRIRTEDGAERPLTELAEIEVGRSYSVIHRRDQLRSITITADVDEDQANAFDIVNDLQATLLPTLNTEFPNLQVRWGGQREQTNDSMNSMLIGFTVVLGAMYLLLTIEFKSLIQPLIVLSIIPFGCAGAIAGHLWMDLSFSLFSIYGLVALAGVVVNDSIVLIDFINRRIEQGAPLNQALLDAGQRRFRPVLLTSVTTIAGVLPILLETQRQALVLIPMATSLAFGLMLTTVLVLVLAPTFYLVAERLRNLIPMPYDEDEELALPLATETVQ